MKKMWKALAVLTAIALFGSAFTACKSDDDGDDDVSVTGVRLDKTSAELEVGGTLKLTATIEPANATNQNVSWSSSDKNVATVDENGTVTAVAVGTDVVITVKTADGGKEAKCTITVNEKASGSEGEGSGSGSGSEGEGSGSGSEGGSSGGSDNTGDMKVEIKF